MITLTRQDNLLELLDALSDGVLGETQASVLEGILAHDAEARQLYLSYMHLRIYAQYLADVECAASSNSDLAEAFSESDCWVKNDGFPEGAIERIGVDADAPRPPQAGEALDSGRSTSGSRPFLGFLGGAYRGTVGFFSQEVPFAWLIAALALGLGMWIGSLIPVAQHVQIAGKSSPSAAEPSAFEKVEYVGRIAGMVDCRWERTGSGIRDWGLEDGSGFRVQGSGVRVQGSGLPSPSGRGAGGEGGQSPIPNPQSLVHLGDKFALASGVMQIAYDTGATVILQGPCTYEVESAVGGFLSLGKLTARIGERGERRGEREKTRAEGGGRRAEEAANQKSEIINHKSNPQSLIPNPSLSTIHYPLFTIKTPTAVITDLGTEFGVEVDKQGLATAHVFRGSVKLQVASVDGKAEGVAQVLHENQSARVELPNGKHGASRLVMLVPTFAPSTFVREIPKLTVKTLDLVDVVAGGDGFSGRRGQGIDPTNGRLASAMPPTAKSNSDYMRGDGKYHRVEQLPFIDGVFIPDGSAGVVQTDSAGNTFAAFSTTSNQTSDYVWAGGPIPFDPPAAVRTELGGIDYASSGHGLLFLQSNKGITFDLEAIRRANPGCQITRFRAAAGNTETASENGAAVYADLWVLIDGQARFQHRQISSIHGAFNINVPLNPKDRFLTLASTDGGNGIYWDWIIFGDPRLEMAPETKTQPELPPQ